MIKYLLCENILRRELCKTYVVTYSNSLAHLATYWPVFLHNELTVQRANLYGGGAAGRHAIKPTRHQSDRYTS